MTYRIRRISKKKRYMSVDLQKETPAARCESPKRTIMPIGGNLLALFASRTALNGCISVRRKKKEVKSGAPSSGYSRANRDLIITHLILDAWQFSLCTACEAVVAASHLRYPARELFRKLLSVSLQLETECGFVADSAWLQCVRVREDVMPCLTVLAVEAHCSSLQRNNKTLI